MIITLCGSTRFKETFQSEEARLTLEGHVVLTPACLWHADGQQPTPEQREVLDRVYDEKIRLADEVRFLNVSGYMGDQTLRELGLAYALGKKLTFLEPSGIDVALSMGMRPPSRDFFKSRP